MPPLFLHKSGITTIADTLRMAPRRHVALSLSIENLFDEAHVEARQEVWIPPEEMKRTIYGKATWVF